MVSIRLPPPSPLPAPPRPRCPLCGAENPHLTKRITRISNRNGNAGRPYLKCDPCGRFVTFLDDRGVNSGNLLCYCGNASRIQVSGKHKGRHLHYVCSTGECDFYDEAKDDKKKTIGVDEDLLTKLVQLKLV